MLWPIGSSRGHAGQFSWDPIPFKCLSNDETAKMFACVAGIETGRRVTQWHLWSSAFNKVHHTFALPEHSIFVVPGVQPRYLCLTTSCHNSGGVLYKLISLDCSSPAHWKRRQMKPVRFESVAFAEGHTLQCCISIRQKMCRLWRGWLKLPHCFNNM